MSTTRSQQAMVAAKMIHLSMSQAARATGCAETSVQTARAIMRTAEPVVVQAVESGNISLYAAGNIAALPRTDQAGALAKQMAIKKDVRGAQQNQQGKLKASPRRPLALRMTRTLDQLDNATEMLEDFFQELGARDNDDYRSWLSRVSQAKKTLSRIIIKGVAQI